MADLLRARLFVAGTDARGRALLARIEIAGDELRVVERAYVDPALRGGRGASPGVIAGLAEIDDCRGGRWLLASVERGRPRLIDPERLGVVALLGRRREWRGAAEVQSPFLPILCDRPPRAVGGHAFMASRSPAGAVDLLRIRPGAPLERWLLGEHTRRVELLADGSGLLLVAGDRVASIDLAELVPGGEPLTDPRDVELSLNWQTLPSTVVVVVDGVWMIEREGDQWFASTLELGEMQRRVRWPIERPRRWLSCAGSLWLADDESWTRIDAHEGPCDRGIAPSPISGPCALELHDQTGPWLWWWSRESSTLHRANARSLAAGPISSWTTQPCRIEQLLVAEISPPGELSTLIHADELAELLVLEPSLADRWRESFDR